MFQTIFLGCQHIFFAYFRYTNRSETINTFDEYIFESINTFDEYIFFQWSPEKEKGTFLSSYLGGTFGTVVTYPMCG